jgi:hypothetical protein
VASASRALRLCANQERGFGTRGELLACNVVG